MQNALFSLRATLSPDRDLRRLFWLLRRAPLEQAHSAALAVIEARARKQLLGEWARPGERAMIRVLFNLHRGTRIRILT